MSEQQFYAFAERLLAFESGIDPAKFDWYLQYFDRPAMRYWKVEYPGRIVRRADDGEPLAEQVSIAEYFERIGVLAYFRSDSIQCIADMQVRSMNPWGFVGFQFGECALIDLGYYRPLKRTIEAGQSFKEAPTYYSGALPNLCWRQGVTEQLVLGQGDSQPFIATDVNRWQGRFTGKGGVQAFSDLFSLPVQFRIFAELVRANVDALEAAFGAQMAGWVSRGMLSGLVAAAHLTGVSAVLAWLRTKQSAADEAGTTIEAYLARFSGFEFDGGDVANAVAAGAELERGPWREAVRRSIGSSALATELGDEPL